MRIMSNYPMPSYNPQWSQQPAVPAPVKRKQVGWAFQLILAAAVLQLISVAFGIVNFSSSTFRQTMSDTIAKQKLPAGTNATDMVSIGIATAIGVAIAVAVVAVVLYVVIGLFINRGAGWARITGLVLAVVSLTQLANMSMPAGIFTILQVLAGIAAIVLCCIQPGSLYFADTKASKLANKGR